MTVNIPETARDPRLLGSSAGANYLYAVDSKGGTIHVFDSNFTDVTPTTGDRDRH